MPITKELRAISITKEIYYIVLTRDFPEALSVKNTKVTFLINSLVSRINLEAPYMSSNTFARLCFLPNFQATFIS